MEIQKCKECKCLPMYVYDKINSDQGSWKVLRCEKGHGMVFVRGTFEEAIMKWNKKQRQALKDIRDV